MMYHFTTRQILLPSLIVMTGGGVGGWGAIRPSGDPVTPRCPPLG
jgi:hypothetical protein